MRCEYSGHRVPYIHMIYDRLGVVTGRYRCWSTDSCSPDAAVAGLAASTHLASCHCDTSSAVRTCTSMPARGRMKYAYMQRRMTPCQGTTSNVS